MCLYCTSKRGKISLGYVSYGFLLWDFSLWDCCFVVCGLGIFIKQDGPLQYKRVYSNM